MTLTQVVYHGTTMKRAELMVRFGVAFTPLFVVSDFTTAVHYARARAALDIHELDPKAVPAIFTLNVPVQHLEVDDYSEHEPGQYKIHSPNTWLRAGELQPHMNDWPPKTRIELLRLQAFAVGMSKYMEDDRVVTSVGKAMLRQT